GIPFPLGALGAQPATYLDRLRDRRPAEEGRRDVHRRRRITSETIVEAGSHPEARPGREDTVAAEAGRLEVTDKRIGLDGEADPAVGELSGKRCRLRREIGRPRWPTGDHRNWNPLRAQSGGEQRHERNHLVKAHHNLTAEGPSSSTSMVRPS